ncbi:DEKNAAC104754 [Brettanomyces naardenensis]|uniref:DEKNAAC104754 n=1 Tax=Brettanomyces naardenensis TaxID=13370 RepID=A0A448YR54_BRENA|nr:DEKNAAC104754 [Brettanomyces naardenensis]
MSPSVLKICTHSGTFHADESLAVYMLKLLKRFSNATVVRSRKNEDWEAADIVVDVSGKYDGKKFFDHHQREFTGTFNSNYKTKLSSAGLVFKHFGKEIIAELLDIDEQKKPKDVEMLYDRVYKDFIEAVDANDNGIDKYSNQDELVGRFHDRNFSLAGVVSNLNPSWNSDPTDADFDRMFIKASTIMGEAFVEYLTYMGKSFLPAKKFVEAAFNSRKEIDESGKIVLLDRYVPWKEHIYAIEKENNVVGQILYILFPDTNGNWRITAVPVTSSSFDSRKKLPKEWRGLRDEALSKKSGIPNCVFIHAAGFTGGVESKEGAIKLAKMSL